MMRSDASLKGKIKALAKKSNLKPQELLQMYLFEHLLMRLGKSGYAEAFVLKGGLLISSMTGVAQRTTMDMDTTVIGMDMDEDTVSEAVAAICAVDVADGMEYSYLLVVAFGSRISNAFKCNADSGGQGCRHGRWGAGRDPAKENGILPRSGKAAD